MGIDGVTMKLTDLAAWWGAVISTLILIFEFIKWRFDNKLVVGIPSHPNLHNSGHNYRDQVLQITVFNKSHRKAYINSVNVYNSVGKKMNIFWSNAIDSVGNTINESDLIGIVDEEQIYIREHTCTPFLSYTRIEISHSFSKKPLITVFDPHAESDTNKD
jgi:hypothetical protein